MDRDNAELLEALMTELAAMPKVAPMPERSYAAIDENELLDLMPTDIPRRRRIGFNPLSKARTAAYWVLNAVAKEAHRENEPRYLTVPLSLERKAFALDVCQFVSERLLQNHLTSVTFRYNDWLHAMELIVHPVWQAGKDRPLSHELGGMDGLTDDEILASLAELDLFGD